MKITFVLLIFPILIFSQSIYEENIKSASNYLINKQFDLAEEYATKCLIEKPDDIKGLSIMTSALLFSGQHKLSSLYANKWIKISKDEGNKKQQVFSMWAQGLNFFYMGRDNYCDFWYAAILVGKEYLSTEQFELANKECVEKNK